MKGYVKRIFDFPALNEKELFYAYILRYHDYSGNRYIDTTFKEFYGSEKNMRTVLFPKKIAASLHDLKLDADCYIYNHSAMPYFQLFLKRNTFEQICNEMLHSDVSYILKMREQQGIKAKIKSDRLYYCPKCMAEHMTIDNIKTSHQIREVYVCAKHKCYLNSMPLVSYKKILNLKGWDFSVRYCEPESLLIGIAEDVDYIINNPPNMDNIELREYLFDVALQRGTYRFGKWREDVFSEWKNHYLNLPTEYSQYDKSLSFEKFASSKSTGPIEPIEYLIFIRSLFGNFKEFIEYKIG